MKQLKDKKDRKEVKETKSVPSSYRGTSLSLVRSTQSRKILSLSVEFSSLLPLFRPMTHPV